LLDSDDVDLLATAFLGTSDVLEFVFVDEF
jgi:hypothetical protein